MSGFRPESESDVVRGGEPRPAWQSRARRVASGSERAAGGLFSSDPHSCGGAAPTLLLPLFPAASRSAVRGAAADFPEQEQANGPSTEQRTAPAELPRPILRLRASAGALAADQPADRRAGAHDGRDAAGWRGEDCRPAQAPRGKGLLRARGAGNWLPDPEGSAAEMAATAPRRVFEAAAMEACADRGHLWRSVRIWHQVVHQECARCGATPSPGWGPPDREDAERSPGVARAAAGSPRRATGAQRAGRGRPSSLAIAERNRQVLADLEAGGDPAEIGQRHGISRDSVYWVRRSAKLAAQRGEGGAK